MMFRNLTLAAAAAAAVVAAPAAALTYKGTWRVDQGPNWSVAPPAYTGQQAAALLFGGDPSRYLISTVDSNPANIDRLAWVSTYAGACNGDFPCGTKVADNVVVSNGGLYNDFGNQSAYVQDWALGDTYRNYAFYDGGSAVPEPASWAMLIAGFGLVGAAARRRRMAAAA